MPTLLILFVLCAPAPAMAYVDPGTGMVLWQGLVAALGALILFMRRPRQELGTLLRRLMKMFRR